jgi:hypothetical protein
VLGVRFGGFKSAKAHLLKPSPFRIHATATAMRQEMAPGQQLFEEILHFLDPSEFEDRA